ncbi:hypothetical protein A5735_04855 [Mycolicibacter heraklionensis]|nr:hypothetical protein A5735_04855 [Mycolicibacter heraklionensis]
MASIAVTQKIPFNEPEAVVVPAQLAVFLHTTEQVLAQDRYRGRGIPYVRYGRRILYRVKDIQSYLDANTHEMGA